MTNAPTLVTFLTRWKLFQVPWPELDLCLEERYSEPGSPEWRITSLRADGKRFDPLMCGSKAECQAALRIIFEFIANCGQIETPSIMIDMEAVAQAAKKRA